MTAQDHSWFFEPELERHQQTFEKGDYFGLLEALKLCCWNKWPLPDWVSKVVIRQAEDVFLQGSSGPGKHGNWRARREAIEINRRRPGLVAIHRQALRKKGRHYVSGLAFHCGYGKPTGAEENIATLDDIFEYVSKQVRGTPARGSADAVRNSYFAVKRDWKRKPRRRVARKAAHR
jgi:hypothetical protein